VKDQWYYLREVIGKKEGTADGKAKWARLRHGKE
jgi:hypothetical protein